MTITAYSITEWAFLTEHPLFRKLIRKDPIAGWVLYRILWDYSAKERTEVFRCWESLDDLIDQLHLWTRFDRATIEKSMPALLSSKLCAYQDGVFYVYGSEKKHTSPRCKRWKETARQNLTEHDTLCQEMSRHVTTCHEIEKANSEKPVEKPICDTFVTENDMTRHDLTGSGTTSTCPSKSDTEHEHEHEHEHERVRDNEHEQEQGCREKPIAIYKPMNLPSDARQDSSSPPICTMRTAPLEEQNKTVKTQNWRNFVKGDSPPRTLTAEGEEFIRDFHDHLTNGSEDGGCKRRKAAYDMLIDSIGLNAGRSAVITTRDPLRATLWLCSALVDTDSEPARLLITLIKKNADLAGTRIYEIVKRTLNGQLKSKHPEPVGGLL